MDDSGTQSCMVDGRTVAHKETYDDNCNTCRCLNGRKDCTRLDCDDDDDEDNDNDDNNDHDNDDDRPDCSRVLRAPVCAVNLHTYPNRCAAVADDFEGPEIIKGACTPQVMKLKTGSTSSSDV